MALASSGWRSTWPRSAGRSPSHAAVNTSSMAPCSTSGSTLLCLGVVLEQPLDQSLDDPVPTGLPGVRPRTQKDAVGCLRVADANDLQVAPLDRFADRRDLDRQSRLD